MSRDWLQTHDLFCAGQNQMRGRSWEHKARDFSVQLINLPTSLPFVSGKSESWILFSRTFLHHAVINSHLKRIRM